MAVEVLFQEFVIHLLCQVDHSFSSWCSHKRMKLQGHRASAKGKYKILHKFYYSAMQQISDKWLWWSSMSILNWSHSRLQVKLIKYWHGGASQPFVTDLLHCWIIKLVENDIFAFGRTSVPLKFHPFKWTPRVMRGHYTVVHSFTSLCWSSLSRVFNSPALSILLFLQFLVLHTQALLFPPPKQVI